MAAQHAATTTPGTSLPLDVVRLRHDFKTPLNGIIGYGEMICEEAEGRGLDELIGDSRKLVLGARELVSVVDDVFAGPPAPALADAAREANRRLRPPALSTLELCQLWLETLEEDSEDLRELLVRVAEAASQLVAMVEDLSPDPSGRSGRFELAAVLPAAAPAGPDLGALRSTTLMETVPIGSGHILVVDDVDLNRDLLRRRLERAWYDVTLASSGEEALALVDEQDFDLVLLDILMPGKSGVDVLAELKAHPEHRHLPVIVISALNELDSVVRCLEMGAEDYLTKPFQPAILSARIQASLERKALRDAEQSHQEAIARQKDKVDQLLHALFPPQVVTELKESGTITPRRYEGVAVLFADVVGFTSYSEARPPEEVVAALQELVAELEATLEDHGLLKIKTIGDSIMACAGLFGRRPDPLRRAVACAVDMVARASRVGAGWTLRVGLHAGPVVAGVVGQRQYVFDLWGDTVNTAARVESRGTPGFVTVSSEVWRAVEGAWVGESQGLVELKGRSSLELIRVLGPAA